MGKTFRKDAQDIAKKQGAPVFMGTVLSDAEPSWRLHRDKKKPYKPGVAHKKVLHKGRKTKLRLTHSVDFDNVPLPLEKKSDVWCFN